MLLFPRKALFFFFSVKPPHLLCEFLEGSACVTLSRLSTPSFGREKCHSFINSALRERERQRNKNTKSLETTILFFFSSMCYCFKGTFCFASLLLSLLSFWFPFLFIYTLHRNGVHFLSFFRLPCCTKTQTHLHTTQLCAHVLSHKHKSAFWVDNITLYLLVSLCILAYIYTYMLFFFFTQFHFSLFFFIWCYLSSCNLDCIPHCLGSHLPCKLVLTHTSLYSLTYTTFSEKRKINAPHCLVSERAKERKKEGLASRPVLRFNLWLYSPFSLLPSHFLSSTFLALLLRRFS